MRQMDRETFREWKSWRVGHFDSWTVRQLESGTVGGLDNWVFLAINAISELVAQCDSHLVVGRTSRVAMASGKDIKLERFPEKEEQFPLQGGQPRQEPGAAGCIKWRYVSLSPFTK